MLYTISRYSPEILQRVCMREDRYSLCNEGVGSYFTINIPRQAQMEGKIQISSDYPYNVTLFCVFLPQIEWRECHRILHPKCSYQYDNTLKTAVWQTDKRNVGPGSPLECNQDKFEIITLPSIYRMNLSVGFGFGSVSWWSQALPPQPY